MMYASHDDDINVVGCGKIGEHFGRMAHDHMLAFGWDTIAFNHLVERCDLNIEQTTGLARRRE
ncbi:hypothetical protein D3C71_1799100 [compost metagenome]